MKDLARRIEVDLYAVLGTTGITVVVIGLAQLVAVAAGLWDEHPLLLRLVLGAVATVAAGAALLPLRAQATKWRRRESLAIVALSWIAATCAASVPFVACGQCGIPGALLEAASGLTTTGATVFPDVDGIPPPLHLWRALCHWMGGAGIVLVVLVLTPWLDNAEALRRTQRAEASVLTERYEGSTRATLRGLLAVYGGATLLQAVLLMLLGMSAWDAVLHSMATISTGGFSTRTASLGAWGDAVQLVTCAFMVLGALNFAVLGRSLTGGGVRALLRSAEVKGYVLMLVFACAATAAVLVVGGDPARYGDHGLEGVWRAGVDATFTIVSISTTTGFCTENYAGWPASAQLLLLGLMVVGGCTGSTAGGIKFRRALILCKHAYREVRVLAYPGAVMPLQIDGQEVSEREVGAALSYVMTYMLLLFGVGLLVALTGSDPVSAGGASVSAMGSIGPAFGDCDPSGSFKPFAASAKILLAYAMLLGRLEIFPLLTVALPSFWIRRGLRSVARPPAR